MNVTLYFRASLFVFSALHSLCFIYANDQSSPAPPLSPEDSIATMKIQPGYSLTPVLAEPKIHEPTAIAWDGNGRMYVVEMRSYMQEIDGNNQLEPVSRVSRHEDTDGDGIYDKHTIFADNLSLPRMVLPLLDRVIIRETNTFDLKSYQDTNDDGVADKIEMWHEGGDRGGNLEHQPSGLIWNIDNWLYTTYSAHRYRCTDGDVIREPLSHGSGQWGLTHDDEGRIFYSTAGGENPAMDFQRPIVYGKFSLPGEQVEGFRECFPIDNVPDVQGGRGRVRDDNSLNRFTGCCGQSIYRGDRMPADFSGNLIIPEPVGRLVRRAKVINDEGRIVVANAYENEEFIAAKDANFRPVNSATGPDGCLYIVDMYRGIIQEGNWVREGSYLRGIVQKYDLDKNIGRGRIYRVDHKTTRRGRQPRMLDETPAQLLAHLSHSNGWWRSQAQKLIVLHSDMSVVPALKTLAITADEPLARLHALWTLEGLNAITPALLRHSFADSDPRVRSAAVRISEPLMTTDRSIDAAISRLAEDANPNVAIQTLLSVNHGANPHADKITHQILASHEGNVAIDGLYSQIKSHRETRLAEQRKLNEMRRRNKLLADSVVRGKLTYNTLCINCHGADGKGQPSPDHHDKMLAPPLLGSSRVQGHKERLTRILLDGLIGPVDEKTYSGGLMLPLAANADSWIADVATYIRNAWDNKASLVEPADIARIRDQSTGRIGPWSLAELKYYDPPTLDRGNWKLTASHNSDNVLSAIDGKGNSRWDTGTVQKPGMWFGIELVEPVKLMSLTLNTSQSSQDYPRGYLVHISSNGKDWGLPVAKGVGHHAITEIEVDSSAPTKFIRIIQTGNSASKYWSIHDLQVKALSQRDKPPESLAKILADADPQQLATEARSKGIVSSGAKLFFSQSLSCAKCHDPLSGDRLGPDLASKRDGVTDRFLVQAVLNPSINIRHEYAQVMVLTIDGLTVTGFKHSEDDMTLVLRDPASGNLIKINQDDIEFMKESQVSAMPAGLVNPLTGKQQFLDLVHFLIVTNEGGPRTWKKLKNEAIKK